MLCIFIFLLLETVHFPVQRKKKTSEVLSAGLVAQLCETVSGVATEVCAGILKYLGGAISSSAIGIVHYVMLIRFICI